MTDDDDINERDLLAAEYALGLMSQQEAAAFEAALGDDDRLRTAYVMWVEHLAAMVADVAPVAPPDAVLEKVQHVLALPEVDESGFETLAVGDDEDVAQPVSPPVQSAPRKAKGPSLGDRLGGLFERLGLIPAMGAGLAAALAVLWVIDLSGLMEPEKSNWADATAMLTSEDESLVVRVAYGNDGETLRITRSAGAAPEGQVLQLWVIKDDNPPVSLGILPDEETGTLQVAADIRPLLRGARCAISVEPPGGSPTGTPTGAILATAPIVWDT